MLYFNPAIIALCRGPSPASIYTINVDNFVGTRLLLDHLVNLGHRCFGFIDGGWLGDIRERREAFQDYLSSHHLPYHSDWTQLEANSAECGYRAMQKLLGLPDRPTAIFASDDVMAIGVMKAIADVGWSVPKDFSVVGFDNIEFSQYLNPSLTTIRQPVVLVDAPEAVRLHRLVTMRGLPREDAERLIATQLPSDSKRPRSQFVIDNDGDRAQLERRARDVWLALEARATA